MPPQSILKKLRADRNLKFKRWYELNRLNFDDTEVIAKQLMKTLSFEIDVLDSKIEVIKRDMKGGFNGKRNQAV